MFILFDLILINAAMGCIRARLLVRSFGVVRKSLDSSSWHILRAIVLGALKGIVWA